MTSDHAKPGKIGVRPSSSDRAANIFSALQGAKYLHDALSGLSSQAQDALIADIAGLVSQGTPEDIAPSIIQLIRAHVAGFSESWARFEAEGHSTSRLLVV